ncbi:MAG: hypothetical protein Kow0077_21360 [Anaerolineae bacterium]
MAEVPQPPDLSALARFVLQTVEVLRATTGELASELALKGVAIREITFSIPYDPVAQHLLLDVTAGPFEPRQLATVPMLRLPQAIEVLRQITPQVVFDRARLVQAPAERLARLEITIQF